MVIVTTSLVMSLPDDTLLCKLVIGEIIISIKLTDFPEENLFVADTGTPLKPSTGTYILFRRDCNDVS